MQDDVARYFGIIIAFVIPGFVGLYAVSFFAPVVADWLGIVAKESTSVGGFLFAVLGSIGMGLFLSAVRACVMDRHFTSPPSLNIKRRGEDGIEAAYLNILAHHYPYYQFCSTMLFALAAVYVAWLTQAHPSTRRIVVVSILLAGAEGVLFWAARDAMNRYTTKVHDLLGFTPSPRQHRTA